jgi:hypothetical protein
MQSFDRKVGPDQCVKQCIGSEANGITSNVLGEPALVQKDSTRCAR